MKMVQNRQPELLFNVPSEDVRRWVVDRSNPANPFHTFVGNDDVVNKLLRMAYAALGRPNHNANDIRLALLGPAGTGKTTVANKLAAMLELPFADVNPNSIRTTHDLFLAIAQACAGVGFQYEDGQIVSLALRSQETEKHYKAPPMVLFIDEVHLLKGDVEQGLLTATDSRVNRLVTNEGFILDTSNICWVIATTESGKLFHALKTRFSKAHLKPYNEEQVAAIVVNGVRERKGIDLPYDVARKIAFYAGTVTREAIDFAIEVDLERSFSGSTWDEAVETIRQEKRIDEFGMEERRLNILKALASKGPLSQQRLLLVAECQLEELKDEVLPPLLRFSDGKESLIVTGSKGYSITEQGIEELKRRGIDAELAGA